MRSIWWRSLPLLLPGLIGILALIFAPPGAVKLISNLRQVLGTAVGAAYLFAAAGAFASDEPPRRGWRLLAFALAANSLGFAIYGGLELVGFDDPFPSVADLFWIITYPLAIMGIMDLARRYRESGLPMGRPRWALAVGAGSLIIAVAVLLLPMVQDTETPLWHRAILMAYPLGDVILIAAATYMAELMAGFGRGALAWPWVALVAGFVLMALSDSVYALLDLYGLYHTGDLIDTGWVLSGVLMGLGGFLQWRIMTRSLAGEGGHDAA